MTLPPFVDALITFECWDWARKYDWALDWFHLDGDTGSNFRKRATRAEMATRISDLNPVQHAKF